MTIGIYKLSWNSTNRVYIGQSINIQNRYREHCLKLRTNKHYNKKLQEYYNTQLEVPEIEILLECSTELLNSKEIYYIDKYNSYNLGFNSTKGGNSLYGENSPLSKYSNSEIEEAFKLICTREIPLKEIAEFCNISLDVIKSISRGLNHSWLKDKYPEEYTSLLKTKRTVDVSIGDNHPCSKYSNEEIAELFLKHLVNRKESFLEISRKTNVGYETITEISRGEGHTWLKVKYPEEYLTMLKNSKKRIKEYPKITNGIEIVIVTNATEFCRNNNLTLPNLSKVFNGERPSHKGWRLATNE